MLPAPMADEEVYAGELIEPEVPCETTPAAPNSNIPWWGYAVAMVVLVGTVGGMIYLYFQKTPSQQDVAQTPDNTPNTTSQPVFGPPEEASQRSNQPPDTPKTNKTPGFPAPPPMPPPPKLPPLAKEVAETIIAEKREILPGTWYTDLPYPITIFYAADGSVILTVSPPERPAQQFQGRWRIVEAINQRTLVIEWEGPTQRRQRMEVVFELDGDIQHPIWGQPRLIPKFSKKK
jgi:type IV secretory pathway VirB10-like protein